MIDQPSKLPANTPLKRLLKPRIIKKLLIEFQALMPHQALMPQVALALLNTDGQPLIHTENWEPAAPISLPPELTSRDDDTPPKADGFRQADGLCFYPLSTNDTLIGILTATRTSTDIPWPHAALQALQSSLTLLLNAAQEKRDVVQEALDRYREINLLYQVGETIGACLDVEAIPNLVLAEAQRAIQADVGLVQVSTVRHSSDATIKASFGPTPQTVTLYAAAQKLIEQAHHTGKSSITNFSAVGNNAVQAILCAPLKTADQVIGAVLLGRGVGQTAFTASDEKLVAALASQAAIAIEKAWLHQEALKRQRMEEELAVGREIQLSFLPEAAPTIPGWDFAAVYQAAQQVGGDLYDFFNLPGEARRLGLVMADVTGKGVPAALYMAFCRAVFRTGSMSGRHPSDVLERANQLIYQDNRAKLFLSALYATLSLDTGLFTFASAGHHWPLWLQASSGKIEELEVRGTILGAFPHITLEAKSVQLAAGDLLIFFTDGVIEAMNNQNQMFGEIRLCEVLKAYRWANANEILQAIVNAVSTFIGNTPLSDDFTLLVVKRQG